MATGISLRVREALDACSSSIECEGIVQSDKAVAPVIGLLHSLTESSPSDLVERLPEIESLEAALDEIFMFLASPDSNQVIVDALSLELPKLVTKFALLSDRCRETAGRIIEHLISVSSPREMLLVLCEVTVLNLSWLIMLCYVI
ncbi:Aberrant root formation protein 4 [Apostasia shenzhenica]|uniref:Aberrant root formation protein 4 n=1 Tax=Apostasia shenzhenica TaxID=1088818 RepID=A0A2H9ZU57_9ASPA|nr:Aberrant root formation protein 4 [Apostasia shenzhenica]